jgi:hypothetical protein
VNRADVPIVLAALADALPEHAPPIDDALVDQWHRVALSGVDPADAVAAVAVLVEGWTEDRWPRPAELADARRKAETRKQIALAKESLANAKPPPRVFGGHR